MMQGRILDPCQLFIFQSSTRGEPAHLQELPGFGRLFKAPFDTLHPKKLDQFLRSHEYGGSQRSHLLVHHRRLAHQLLAHLTLPSDSMHKLQDPVPRCHGIRHLYSLDRARPPTPSQATLEPCPSLRRDGNHLRPGCRSADSHSLLQLTTCKLILLIQIRLLIGSKIPELRPARPRKSLKV